MLTMLIHAIIWSFSETFETFGDGSDLFHKVNITKKLAKGSFC